MDGLKLLILVFNVLQYVESANILYVVPFTSTSHYIMLKPIGLELAKRGHNVTVITGHRHENPPENYHQVLVDDKQIWDVLGIQRPNVFDMVKISAEEFHNLIFWEGGLAFTELALNSSQVKHFLQQDNRYDLVISEQFYQEALYVLAHKYRTPLVLITTFGNCMRHNILQRNPLQLATVISEFLDLDEPTSFWARFRNFYFTIYEYVWWKYWYLNYQEKLVQKYIPHLPEPVPSLYELQRNASLFLINGHFSFDPPAAYLPNIVEIGGVHLTKSETKLPEDLQNILDDAKHGVVYVNFGTNVRSSELPLEKKNAFLNVFKRLNQTVLWKWEDDNLGEKPKNLVIRKWLPQKEILAHPNIKVFVSHGGLIGTQEAVFNGVPIIGVPIYADQYNNLLQAKYLGFGNILQFNDITEENVYSILNEVLNGDKYRNKAKEISARFKDRPLNALDTAMFWIEYVIRNNGAHYMKSPALDLSWFAYNMIDVYAFVAIAIFGSLFVIYKVTKIVRRAVSPSKNVKSNKKHQ